MILVLGVIWIPVLLVMWVASGTNVLGRLLAMLLFAGALWLSGKVIDHFPD